MTLETQASLALIMLVPPNQSLNSAVYRTIPFGTPEEVLWYRVCIVAIHVRRLHDARGW
jgi:hypothetical protein